MGLAWSRICYMRFLYGNLSSSGLVGEIPSIIGNLTELQYLDLSRNDLTGDIPDFLCGLSHLGFLDLSGNGLNASIPQALRERVAAGTLTLRIGNTTNLCGYPNSCGNSIDKKSSKKVLIAVAATISSVLLLVAVLVIICILRKCTGDKVKKEGASCGEIGCKEFAFEDLVRITRNFSKEIGKGAFGHVYYGELDGNISVAVKVLLITPLQGLEEFKKEASFPPESVTRTWYCWKAIVTKRTTGHLFTSIYKEEIWRIIVFVTFTGLSKLTGSYYSIAQSKTSKPVALSELDMQRQTNV